MWKCLLTSVFLMGCVDQVELELDLTGYRSFILALETDDAIQMVVAENTGEAVSFSLGSQTSEATLLLYDEPLDHYKMEPGRLYYLSSGRQIPQTEHSQRSTFTDGRFSAWEPITSTISERLRRFRFGSMQTEPECKIVYQTTSVLIEGGAVVTALFQLPSGAIIAACENGAVYEIHFDTQTTELLSKRRISNAAGWGYGDTLWVADPEGNLTALTFTSTTVTTTTITSISDWSESPTDMGGGPTAGGVELFVLGRDREVLWYQPGEAPSVFDVGEPQLRRRVSWRAPGEMYFTDRGPLVHHLDSGRITGIDSPMEDSTAIAHHPTRGTMVAAVAESLARFIYHLDDEGWSQVAQLSITTSINDLAIDDRNIALAGTRGTFEAIPETDPDHPSGGCPVYLTSKHLNDLILLDGNRAVVSGGTADEGPEVWLVCWRSPEEASCL